VQLRPGVIQMEGGSSCSNLERIFASAPAAPSQRTLSCPACSGGWTRHAGSLLHLQISEKTAPDWHPLDLRAVLQLPCAKLSQLQSFESSATHHSGWCLQACEVDSAQQGSQVVCPPLLALRSLTRLELQHVGRYQVIPCSQRPQALAAAGGCNVTAAAA